MNIFLGLLIVSVGGISIYYAKSFERWFGRWSWAEQYLGGTAQGYIIVGFLLIILGVMALFGVVDLTR